MNEFEFETLGQVQPQFNPMRADLGINQYAAEFERQNRGMERVQRQVEANQRMLLKNAETFQRDRALCTVIYPWLQQLLVATTAETLDIAG